LLEMSGYATYRAIAALTCLGGVLYTAEMGDAKNIKPKPGDQVVLAEIPSGLLDGLPSEDQDAIREIVGKPIRLEEYDDAGRAELAFRDRNGHLHYIYVSPQFIRPTTT
jgi:hypothetical protein